MIFYLMRRLLSMVPLLLGITLISFFVIQLAPGGPIAMQMDLNPKASAEAIERLRAAYGLDLPLYQQYWNWLIKLVQFDFGTSFAPDGRPVLDKVLDALPVTLWMNILGLMLVLLIAIPVGVYAAWKPHKLFDRASTLLVFLGFAAPSFWIGLLAMIYFGAQLELVPLSGLSSFGAEEWSFGARVADWAHHLALPITVGIIGSLAGMSRYMRSAMMDALSQDYITTAKAKGATSQAVLYRHALKNALLPVITVLGLSIPGLIGGSVIIESLFALPGMGKLFYDAVMMRDYPLIMCVLTLGAFLTLIGNMIADIAYAAADPRIRI